MIIHPLNYNIIAKHGDLFNQLILEDFRKPL